MGPEAPKGGQKHLGQYRGASGAQYQFVWWRGPYLKFWARRPILNQKGLDWAEVCSLNGGQEGPALDSRWKPLKH